MPSPASGGVIIAINHVSQIDTILMARFAGTTLADLAADFRVAAKHCRADTG